MTKTLTEQWREGTLERGYYYYKTKVGAKVIGYQCFGLKFPYDYNHNTIDSVEEVLSPVPDYYDCKGLIYDSINLNDARKRIDELVQKMHILEKKLEIATKALKKLKNPEKDYLDYIIDKDGNKIDLRSSKIAAKALKEMEGAK